MYTDDIYQLSDEEFIDNERSNRPYRANFPIVSSQDAIGIQTVKAVCNCFVNSMSDHEIALDIWVHKSLIKAIRNKLIFKEISDMYDYPIQYSYECLKIRAAELMECGIPPTGITHYTGAPIHISEKIFIDLGGWSF